MKLTGTQTIVDEVLEYQVVFVARYEIARVHVLLKLIRTVLSADPAVITFCKAVDVHLNSTIRSIITAMPCIIALPRKRKARKEE